MTQFDRLSVRSTYTKVYTASSKLECEGEKEDPRRHILLGMTMTHPIVRRRRSTFYPRTMRAMRTFLKKIKQKKKKSDFHL